MMTDLTNLGLSIGVAREMLEQEKEAKAVKKLQKGEERRIGNVSSQSKS